MKDLRKGDGDGQANVFDKSRKDQTTVSPERSDEVVEVCTR